MEPLSDRIEALRVFWAAYVHDGVEIAPAAAAGIAEVLSSLKQQAEAYEDRLAEGVRLGLSIRAAALVDEQDRKRMVLDAALEARGLSAAVWPAASMLTQEHLEAGDVVLHPRSWRLDRPSSAEERAS